MAMTTLHAAAGISITKMIPNPWISLPLSFISHALLDLYPEYYSDKQGPKWDLKKYDSKEWTLAIVQLLLFIGIIIYLIYMKNWKLFMGAILANIPDLWDFIYKNILKNKTEFWFFHPGGWFPFKLKRYWQEYKLGPLKTAALDFTLVCLMMF